MFDRHLTVIWRQRGIITPFPSRAILADACGNAARTPAIAFLFAKGRFYRASRKSSLALVSSRSTRTGDFTHRIRAAKINASGSVLPRSNAFFHRSPETTVKIFPCTSLVSRARQHLFGDKRQKKDKKEPSPITATKSTNQTMKTKTLTKAQKEKLSTLSIKLLDAGFYGDELKEIMDRAVAKALTTEAAQWNINSSQWATIPAGCSRSDFTIRLMKPWKLASH
jgi:hypothetical protein